MRLKGEIKGGAVKAEWKMPRHGIDAPTKSIDVVKPFL